MINLQTTKNCHRQIDCSIYQQEDNCSSSSGCQAGIAVYDAVQQVLLHLLLPSALNLFCFFFPSAQYLLSPSRRPCKMFSVLSCSELHFHSRGYTEAVVSGPKSIQTGYTFNAGASQINFLTKALIFFNVQKPNNFKALFLNSVFSFIMCLFFTLGSSKTYLDIETPFCNPNLWVVI